MIVFPDAKLVLLTPPHTASGQIMKTARHFGAMLVIGPTPDGCGYDHHTTCVPNGFLDHRVAVVTRHPFARVAGLWHHHCWYSAMRGWTELSLCEFVRLVANDSDQVSWFYRYPLKRWLNGARFDAVVPLERIDVVLTKLLGCPFRLPPHQPTHRPWELDWSNEHTTVLTSWLQEERIGTLDAE